MPFKVNYKGLEVIVDSFDDLDALAIHAKKSEKAPAPQRPQERVAPAESKIDRNKSTEGQLKTFVAALNENAGRVYRVIAQYGQPINDTDLRERLNIETNNHLAGYLAGVTRAAQKATLDPDAVLTKVTRDSRPGHRAYSYGIPTDVMNEVRQIMNIS